MILIVGLSPAWQRTLEFREFIPGNVNRASRVSEMASGKGVNVARVARQLGAEVRLLTVAGGQRGRLLVAGLPTATVVRVKAETRICQTLIAGGVVTELVEEAGALSRNEVAKVLTHFDRESRRAKLIVLTGTVPSGCGDDFYERLIRRATVPVLVDAQRSQLLNAIRARPFVVRINRDELADVPTVGRKSIDWLVVSDGARPITAYHAGKPLVVQPPKVKTVNTIGSGDAMMAGMAVTLLRGGSMPEAIRFGVACGAANALTDLPGFVNPADVKRLLRKVK